MPGGVPAARPSQPVNVEGQRIAVKDENLEAVRSTRSCTRRCGAMPRLHLHLVVVGIELEVFAYCKEASQKRCACESIHLVGKHVAGLRGVSSTRQVKHTF